jgi:hypothetical protein
MDTIQAQEAGNEEVAEGETSAGSYQPAQQQGTKTIRSIEDLFNSTYEADADADTDSKPMKKEEKIIPESKDEKITAKPKQETQETEEQAQEESLIDDSVKQVEKEQPQMFKVKINGSDKDVPLQDLLNSYSGQQEIQRRFTEFDKQKKSWESQTAQEKQFTNFVQQEYSGLREDLSALVSQYQKAGYVEKNPLQVVNQLLDKMGINSNLFERALFEHQLPDYANYFNMSDVEREAFYTKKENEFLRKKEQSFSERDQQVKFQEEKRRKDYELITSAGLDSVKYQESFKELSDAGINDITPEKVVDYVKQKPLLDRIVDVFNQAGQNAVGDERARIVHKLLTEFPDTTNEEILEYLSPEKVALKKAQILNQKGVKTPKAPPQKSEDKEMEELLNWFKR